MGRDREMPTNPVLLQNLIKRDPESYREEFLLQLRHYHNLRAIYLADPGNKDTEQQFAELIGFVSQMCVCFPKDTRDFPDEIASLLKARHNQLSPEVAEKMVQSLTMLRNRSVISSVDLIQTLFPILIASESKAMRSQIYGSLISLIKSENQGTTNQALNRSLQALLFELVENNSEAGNTRGLWATKLVRELWRRNIWDDSRTVEIMVQAATCASAKVAVSAARFFLGADKEREEFQNEDDDSDDEVDVAALKHRLQINKKTSKRGKKLDQVIKTVRKKTKTHHNATSLNFSAIHLLRNPQGFAETLFKAHLKSSSKLTLEHKLLFLNLCSRMIGSHKLIVPDIYSFFLKYLTPKQLNVTQILAAAAQASHNFVPPEDIAPVVAKIAHEFVSDGVASEVAAAGINTIREIVSRAPLAIEQELLHDLTEYKDSKAKSVMMAARSLIAVFRELDPSMLKPKDRGKTAAMAMKGKSGLKFGVDSAEISGIQGIALLQKHKKAESNDQAAEQDKQDNEQDEWEVLSDESDSDSDSGEWVTVESDKEYNISDSDDEDEDEDEDKTQEDKQEKPLTDSEAFLQLAATTVITPADFKKMQELQIEAGFRASTKTEDVVDANALMGGSKFKQSRQERIDHANEGREGREFGSGKGKKLDNKQHSTTNKQKARKKNFMMMVHKRDVQGKAKKSLRDKQKSLQAHVARQKRGY